MPSPTPPTQNEKILPRPGDDIQRLEYKSLAVLASGAGVAGVDWVTDTAAYAGDWWFFHAIEDSVIAAITYKTGFVSGSPAGKTIKAGDTISGRIISFTLASGSGYLSRAGL